MSLLDVAFQQTFHLTEISFCLSFWPCINNVLLEGIWAVNVQSELWRITTATSAHEFPRKVFIKRRIIIWWNFGAMIYPHVTQQYAIALQHFVFMSVWHEMLLPSSFVLSHFVPQRTYRFDYITLIQGFHYCTGWLDCNTMPNPLPISDVILLFAYFYISYQPSFNVGAEIT